MKQANDASLLVVRIKMQDAECYIAGALTGQTRTHYKTLKDFNGIAVDHQIPKQGCHLSHCENCPSPETVASSLIKDSTVYPDRQRLGLTR